VVAVVAFAAGLFVVVSVLASSVVTVVLPRGVRTRIGRVVFITVRILFKVRIRSSTSYETRDRVLALYAPISLLALLGTWVIGLMAGYTAMMWAVGVHPLRAAFTMAAGSLTTLGLLTPHTLPQIVLAISAAVFGLGELALLITFLPNIYSDLHRRERDVTKLRTSAGQPPEGVNILVRLHRLERLDARTELWVQWTDWFVEVEEAQTAFLDGAALAASCLALPRDYEAELCIRTGYLFLRRMADLFGLPFDPDPAPTDPIAVTQEEFDEVYGRMADAGLPLRARDESWRDFAGWRVNYDEVLIRLANLVEAPVAPWSSDRGLVAGHSLTFIERIRQ